MSYTTEDVSKAGYHAHHGPQPVSLDCCWFLCELIKFNVRMGKYSITHGWKRWISILKDKIIASNSIQTTSIITSNTHTNAKFRLQKKLMLCLQRQKQSLDHRDQIYSLDDYLLYLLL